MEIIEIFLSNPAAYILGTFIVLFVVKEIITLMDWFRKRFEIKTKDEKQEAELSVVQEDMVHLKDDVSRWETEMQNVQSAVENMNQSILELTDRIAEMQDRQDASTRARIKDRIAEMYRYYSAEERRCWTKMEKEAFDELIQSYERANGVNSFIHEICQPESLTWKIIDGD